MYAILQAWFFFAWLRVVKEKVHSTLSYQFKINLLKMCTSIVWIHISPDNIRAFIFLLRWYYKRIASLIIIWIALWINWQKKNATKSNDIINIVVAICVRARSRSLSFCLSFSLANQHKFRKIVTRFELATLAPAQLFSFNSLQRGSFKLSYIERKPDRRNNEKWDKRETDMLRYNIWKYPPKSTLHTYNNASTVCTTQTRSSYRPNNTI